jgi:hypothetical protein
VGSHVECLLKAISYVCKLRDNDVLCIDVIIKLLVTTKLPVCGCECLCCTVFCGEEIKLNGTHVRYWFRLKLKIIFKNKSLILCSLYDATERWMLKNVNRWSMDLADCMYSAVLFTWGNKKTNMHLQTNTRE